MAGFSAAGLTKGQSGVLKPPKPPGVQKGIGVVGSPTAFGVTKGIPGAGIITTQPRPPGATPGSLGQAPQPTAPPAPPQPSGGSPLDATYYGNVAANQLRTGNQINALNLQESQAGTALQQALGQLAYQQPRDALRVEQGWNWGGRDINSTPYTQAQGDLAHTYLGRQTAAQTTYSNARDTIAARIAAIQAGIPIFNAQEANASTIRASNAAARNAALGAPAAPAAAPAQNPPGTRLRDVTTVRAPTAKQQLRQALAGRKTVTLKPVQRKARPR